MAYQTPITIHDAITSIQKKKYLLPAIQREFVWDTDQIEQLFDSLLREYPISTFLFWEITKNKISDFQLYEFIKDYHQTKNRHNQKAELSKDEGVTAVLDGQQRLTSLYIGLRGSYAEKMPYYRWDSPWAYPKKKLYLNLLEKSKDENFDYEFKFLTEEEALLRDENTFWFQVGKIMDFEELGDITEYLIESEILNNPTYTKDQTKWASKTLNKLFNVIRQKGVISYFEEKGEELDKVLQIFIRVNSGGTKLSYSDLLLSIATAQWGTLDAREVIHEFVDEINSIGSGFNFNKDFVMKSCLVLADINDVRFNVDNFTKSNMKIIEDQWPDISRSLSMAVNLVSGFGFNRDNLTSTNTIIPIAYYIHKNSIPDNFLESGKHDDNRKVILEWLVKTLTKRVFSGTPDSLYPPLRKIINENTGSFPLQQITEHFRGKPKSIVFTEDELDNLLEFEYGSPFTYGILTLLYPGLSSQFKYQIDHIHPRKFFNERQLLKLGLATPEERQEYYSRFNRLPNLQLLKGTVNTEKNGTPFKEFLEDHVGSKSTAQFISDHFLPQTDYSLENFIDFYEQRKIIIKDKLAKVLNIELTSVNKGDNKK